VKDIKTYQDLTACGENETNRISFIRTAIEDHKGSELYRKAVEAWQYYNGENPTINRYEKIIYDMQGRGHVDMFTANHKIASPFFSIAVKQEYNYLLGNGVSFKKESTKQKLGRGVKTFDAQASVAGEYALIGGVSFGFWNMDHIDVFAVTEFVPLYDEENGALMSGIRFWQVDDNKPMRCTLYEPDGFTEYFQPRDKEMQIMQPKRPYRVRTITTEVDGTKIYDGENYPSFPIVPLKNNKNCRSELYGKRNTIDALDLVTSNMVNNVDEGNLIYWVLTNCGGMNDIDDTKFIEQLKMTHVVHADGDAGAKAEAHAIEAPFEGSNTTADMLKRRLYEDFQCFDREAVSAGNQTATAIKATYVPLDLKTDDFERQVTRFISGILELAGIEDEPTYTRNQIVNKAEEIQSVLMCAEYVTPEYITKKLLTLLGDADMAEEILKQQAAEDLDRFAEERENQKEDEVDVQA